MKRIPTRILLLASLSGVIVVHAAGEDWVLGTWELAHDPDGSEKDWLEFRPDGGVYSVWPNGQRVEGIYIVAPNSVKAVFTHEGRDVITTFHFDAQRQVPKIVTSETREESIYRKTDSPPGPQAPWQP